MKRLLAALIVLYAILEAVWRLRLRDRTRRVYGWSPPRVGSEIYGEPGEWTR